MVTPPLATKLQRFYEQLATEREGALARLPDVFTSDLVYRDPFREARGLAEFEPVLERMLAQYKQVSFTGFGVTGSDDAFTLTYSMHLRMAIGPSFVTPLASVCRARGDKISEQLDYFDFPSGLLSPFRLLKTAYRGIVTTFFL